MKTKVIHHLCILIFIEALFFSCSSAPKRVAQIVTTQNLAVKQLDLANTEAERGNYSLASSFMQEAWRLAVSTDSIELRVLVQLSMGNLAFYEKKQDEAQKQWKLALEEAQENNLTELISLSKIYACRGIISYGTEPVKERAQQTITIINNELGSLKKLNELYTAYSYMLLGFAYKELSDWSNAEKMLLDAAKIHENLIYLELTAYDYYALASVYSVSGDYDSAIANTQKAIEFDRRAENSYGLGMDYLAQGDIYKKAQNTQAAKKAYTRSAQIFNAASMYDQEKLVLEKLNGM